MKLKLLYILLLLILLSSCGTNHLRLVNKRHHTAEEEHKQESASINQRDSVAQIGFNTTKSINNPTINESTIDNDEYAAEQKAQPETIITTSYEQKHSNSSSTIDSRDKIKPTNQKVRKNKWGWAFILGGLIIGFLVVQYTRLVQFSIAFIFTGAIIGLALIIIGLVRIFKSSTRRDSINREKFWSWFFIVIGAIGSIPSIILALVSPLLLILGLLICAGLITLGIYRLVKMNRTN